MAALECVLHEILPAEVPPSVSHALLRLQTQDLQVFPHLELAILPEKVGLSGTFGQSKYSEHSVPQPTATSPPPPGVAVDLGGCAK